MAKFKLTHNGKRETENVQTDISGFSSFIVDNLSSVFCYTFPILCFFLLTACNSLEKPKPEPFYGDAARPARREFRWSNGARVPKSFDPATAAAAPETDAARALFEGLTDTNARTLKTVPAIAVDWSTTDDNRTWTFKLRRDARWSNGAIITANDFVRSWKRLAALGSARVAHFNLAANIVGMESAKPAENAAASPPAPEFFSPKNLGENLPPIFSRNDDGAQPKSSGNQIEAERTEPRTPDAANDAAENDGAVEDKAAKDKSKTKTGVKDEKAFGAVAVDDFTLRVSLLNPDKDFPALVAHTMFRPVFGDGKSFESARLSADVVTSGAFRVADVNAADGVTLERSESFWNKGAVSLESVRLVPAANAERALAAYRAGEIDAVTNADFEPLALKLLTPFDDFRRTAHGALNFYEFNRSRAPFGDRRVREALTVSIERERLTEDEMDGASVPATGFLPFAGERALNFSQNVERARNLLAAAGFAGGENFPVVRLVVNRNNVQQRVARAVARMWKQNLNVETEIIVKETNELEAVRAAGDFDVLRRGAIFATTDERANMQLIFAQPGGAQTDAKTPADESALNQSRAENKKTPGENIQTAEARPDEDAAGGAAQNKTPENSAQSNTELPGDGSDNSPAILTEADALNEFAAIPLYFSASFSLVKPYVRGFEANTLDAPSLKDVSIDDDWKARN